MKKEFELYQDEEGNVYDITTDLEQIIIKDLYKAMKRNNEKQEEIERLQEEATYMTNKAYDFYSALLDIKELVVNNACLDERINKCVDDLIYYKCDELLDIVNKALGSDKE